MDEFEVIDRFFTRALHGRDEVRLGIGDDAAVTALPPDRELVIATDTLVCGTHFPEATPARAQGHRCLAVNLSDLAAMAAEPLWCTLAISLPAVDESWLTDFAAGFFSLADRFNVALVGGDTVHGPLATTVTVHGATPPGAHITRSGAADGIYITGWPGQAGAGCRELLAAHPDSDLVDRFLFPEPRIAEALSLRGLATAMIDVSDGLHDDLGKLLVSSELGARLDLKQLPVSPELIAYAGPEEAIALVLTGGDDYELCFTVPVAREAELTRITKRWSCLVTKLGETCSGAGLRWFRNGAEYDVPASSYRHF